MGEGQPVEAYSLPGGRSRSPPLLEIRHREGASQLARRTSNYG